MQQHTVLKAPGITISYDFSNQWLYVNWQGIHNQESSRYGCERMLEAISQWPTSKILNDNTNVTRAELQLTAWGVSWLHDMHAAGLRFLAWVYPPEFKGRQASERVIQGIHRPLVFVASFDSMPEAYTWLRQRRTNE